MSEWVTSCGRRAGTPGSPEHQDLRHLRQILYLTWAQNGAFQGGRLQRRKGFPRVVNSLFNFPLFRGLGAEPPSGKGKNVGCTSPPCLSLPEHSWVRSKWREGVGCQGRGAAQRCNMQHSSGSSESEQERPEKRTEMGPPVGFPTSWLHLPPHTHLTRWRPGRGGPEQEVGGNPRLPRGNGQSMTSYPSSFSSSSSWHRYTTHMAREWIQVGKSYFYPIKAWL